jgi:sugar lactone lactonase YvrE
MIDIGKAAATSFLVICIVAVAAIPAQATGVAFQPGSLPIQARGEGLTETVGAVVVQATASGTVTSGSSITIVYSGALANASSITGTAALNCVIGGVFGCPSGALGASASGAQFTLSFNSNVSFSAGDYIEISQLRMNISALGSGATMVTATLSGSTSAPGTNPITFTQSTVGVVSIVNPSVIGSIPVGGAANAFQTCSVPAGNTFQVSARETYPAAFTSLTDEEAFSSLGAVSNGSLVNIVISNVPAGLAVAYTGYATTGSTPLVISLASGTPAYQVSTGSALTFTFVPTNDSTASLEGFTATFGIGLPNGGNTGLSTTVGSLPAIGTTVNVTAAVSLAPSSGIVSFHTNNEGGGTVASISDCPTALSLSVPNPLSSGTLSTAYSTTLTATGGQTPYTFSLLSGTLPPGLLLSSSGTVSGTPTTGGLYSFTVKVTDNVGATATASTSITVPIVSMVVGASSLAFSTMQGSNPPDQFFNASINASSPTFNPTVTPATNNGGSWLTVATFFSGASTDRSLLVRVTVSSGSLAPGLYTGQVTLTQAGLSGSPALVPVSLRVFATGTVNYSAEPIAIQASSVAGSSPNSQTLSISTIGGVSIVPQISVTTSSGGSWLALSTPATYSFDTTSTVQVNFNAASLPAGFYSGTITATGAGVQNSPLSIPVNLTITSSNVATLSTASVNFANSQSVGSTSPTQPLTLTNNGSAVLSIASIAITGTNSGDFGQSNNCGSSLAGGASCTINVAFTPTTTGARTATLTVTDNASPSVQTATLMGTGAYLSPSITNLSPVSAVVGSSSFTLTVNGSGFVNGVSTVQWNGSQRSTVFVSATQLTATINAADVSSSRTVNVTVVNSTAGGGTSTNAPFTVVGACTYQLSATSASAQLSFSAASVGVLAPFGCNWTAASNSNFLSVTSGASGGGNGTVGYSVAADSVGTRSGTLTIAGQIFTVTQTASSGAQYTISTYAGGIAVATPAVALNTSIAAPAIYTASPVGMFTDAAGNVYFAGLFAVYKVDQGGTLYRIAGNNRSGYSGDGGPAVNAQLSAFGLAGDAAGNIYVADQANSRIRKISPDGIITTYAGTGNSNYSGDGGPATSASLSNPYGVAVDSNGNVYIADSGSERIRMVSPSGIITTVAGGNCCSVGDGGAATAAYLNYPTAVAVDSSGNLYIADTQSFRVRKVSGGIITTIAGTGVDGYSGDGGPATSADIFEPQGLAVDSSGNVYVADGSSRIRVISPSGTIDTVAGGAAGGFAGDGGPATSASLSGAQGVAVDAAGNLYISDTHNNYRVRKVSSGIIDTIAGNGRFFYSGDGGSAVTEGLGQPSGVAVDTSGNVYIADSANNRVRKVANGTMTTLAGTGVSGYGGDNGPAVNALLANPKFVAVDSSGNVYVSDLFNGRVRMISPSGTITTFAGIGAAGYGGDGAAATSAQLYNPAGLAVDASGNLYIADSGNNRIRKVSPGGTITTFAGTGTNGYSGDGGPATSAALNDPQGVALDSAGNVYIADYANSRIRKVSLNGNISTVAGNGSCCYSGDGGPATSAELENPTGVAVDALGNLFVADGASRIRMVGTNGAITTIAGNGNNGYLGDGGPATVAQINQPYGLTLDTAGNIYVADTVNDAIRLLQPLSLSLEAPNPLPGASFFVPYSVNLTAAGGHAPYSFVVFAGALPTGLSLSSSGTISGTPTATGVFSFTIQVTDAANATTTATTSIAVNNPIPSITGLSVVSAMAGSSGFTLTVNGSAFVNGVSMVQWNGSPRSTAFVNAAQLTASINTADLAIAGTFNVTVVNGTPGGGTSSNAPFTVVSICTYQISATNSSATLASSTGSVGVQGPLGCTWSATSNSSFLTIASGASGSGNGTVGYSVAANSTGSTRSGTLTIAGQTFTVTQSVAAVAGPQYTISTYAGGVANTTPSVALSTAIGIPQGLVADAAGNVYFASNYAVYKIDSGGTLYRIAGNNRLGYSGDGGPAINAQLSANGLAQDAAGNIYVADFGNNRIRKISPDGLISTYAGTGQGGFFGDGGPATSANLNGPNGVALDSSGNLYIADTFNVRIRKVTPSGTISTVAGGNLGGFAGDGGAATSAELNDPFAIAVDSSGNLYIGDTYNHRIRKVSGGVITTFAGTGVYGYSGDGGPAISAQIENVQALAVDSSGNVYLADGSSRVRVISASGTITTFAGNGNYGFGGDGGPAIGAPLSQAEGLALDAAGNLYISDAYINYRIRKVSSGTITTIAGNGTFFYLGDGGAPASAGLNAPGGVAVDASGNVYISDTSNNRVRKVAGGTIATLAGNGTLGYSGDGAAAIGAQLDNPHGVAVDSSGDVYVADQDNDRIRMIVPGGTITTVAGNGAYGYTGDGAAAISAAFRDPSGVAVDAAGNIYVADTYNSVVRKFTVGGNISTFAGTGTYGYSGDGGPAISAQLSYPQAVAVDSAGNVYIVDQGNERIRKVTTNGNISTVAGNGSCCGFGDGGPATAAALYSPAGVSVDAQGNLFIADSNGQRVRMVSTTGIITTIAGTGNSGYSGDGGLATVAQLNSPSGVALDSSGNVYVADQNNNAIRRLHPSGLVLEVQSYLPNGMTSVAYSYSLIAEGGRPPYTFSLVSGSLPNGLTLSSSGIISGIPVFSGVFPFTIRVADSAGATATAATTITITGVSTIGTGRISPISLNFGNQTVGVSSATQTVTVTNVGPASLNITGVAVMGDFSQTNNCTIVAPSGTCTITATFTPTVSGLRTGVITIANNGSITPLVARVSGVGVSGSAAPKVSLSNIDLNFGSQALNTTSAAMNVTLANTGGTTLTVSSVSASNSFAANSSCGVVAASGACTISVTFTPAAAGNRQGAVVIVDTAPGSPHVIRLFGTGTGGAAPTIGFSNVGYNVGNQSASTVAQTVTGFSYARVNFENRAVGTPSAAQTITVSNTGSATLTISTVATTGDFSASGCVTSLSPGATCSLSIVFTPSATGVRRGTVALTDNVAGSPQVVWLFGNGT